MFGIPSLEIGLQRSELMLQSTLMSISPADTLTSQAQSQSRMAVEAPVKVARDHRQAQPQMDTM